MIRRLWLSFALLAFLPGCRPSTDTRPDSVYFLVRHAEKVDESESEDPPLTEPGQRRAETLAHLLRDSGIRAVYSSDFIRTRDTAAPLASLLGIEISIYDPNRLDLLTAELLDPPGRYLIVGHSNSTPELVRLLGGEPGSEIANDEYDRLYVLVRRPDARTTTVVLRFEPSGTR